jgi:predicted Na+-dependent transporter
MLLFDAFVVLVRFSIGLRVSGHELMDVMRGRNILIRTLVANCLQIPAIGLLLVYIFPLPRDAMIGLLLLAAIPGHTYFDAIYKTSQESIGLRRWNDGASLPH